MDTQIILKLYKEDRQMVCLLVRFLVHETFSAKAIYSKRSPFVVVFLELVPFFFIRETKF